MRPFATNSIEEAVFLFIGFVLIGVLIGLAI
jgi:hypothetical protein